MELIERKMPAGDWFFALHRGILPLNRMVLRPYLTECLTPWPANDEPDA